MFTGFSKYSLIPIFGTLVGLCFIALLIASIFGYWGPAEGTDKLGLF